MGLVATSTELSLFDLLQVKGLARATCRITVNGREHEGTLYLQDGHVVHATYGELRGEAAAYAILGEQAVQYVATSDVAVPMPNMRVSPGALALEAARRADEANQVVPINAARAARPTHPSQPTAPSSAASPALRRGLPGPLPFVIAGALAAIGGLGAFVATRHTSEAPAGLTAGAPQASAPAARTPAPSAVDVLEASALHPPADSLPVLAQGSPPRSPDPEAALRPTIVCRVLVGADGTVARAEIYQRRPNLTAFEEAALEAVRRYRFEPARRSGVVVAVWVNWPIDFI